MKRKAAIVLVLLFCCLTILVTVNPKMTMADSKGRQYFEARGEVVWEVPTDKKVMALTFDDGPNPNYTPQILDVLKQFHAKATFFVLGARVEKYPELARREAMEGHELANHSFSHVKLSRLTAEKLQQEIEKAQQIIFDTTGQTPHLFRPPRGYYNEMIVNTAKQSGYTVIMWSWHQDTRDWSRPGVEKIVSRVVTNARNGDIVLFHDHGGDRRQTIEALKIILPELEDRGYQFVTISELIKLKQPDPLNISKREGANRYIYR